MGTGFEEEEIAMRCHCCGGRMRDGYSDMPFKLAATRIVIIKELPVLQCEECGEHAFTDAVMERIEATLAKVDHGAELEIVRFAA
jgi:YgiT-type zinc finger domain-containing protein